MDGFPYRKEAEGRFTLQRKRVSIGKGTEDRESVPGTGKRRCPACLGKKRRKKEELGVAAQFLCLECDPACYFVFARF